MCGASNNQATKTKCMKQLQTQTKVENSEREKKREHKRIC